MVTVATVATAFHKRSLLPLAQRRAFMWEMTREVPWVGTRMLEAPVLATDIATRVSRTTHPDLKDSRVVPMRPEKGYISLVAGTLLLSLILHPFLFSLALALIAARLQGMGIVKDSLPPVPEDKELRAKN